MIESLYFDIIDDELVLRLFPYGNLAKGIDISSKLKQFLEKHTSKIELVLTGYFIGRKQDPKDRIAYIKEAVKRYLAQGAVAVTVFLD